MANAIVKYGKVLQKNSWARWMCGRVAKQNKNNLVSVVGQTGSGKTYSAMAVAEIMSEIDGIEFNVKHIVFSLSELMDLINSGTLKKGSKIIFDEPQISISARDFQSEANKVFNFLLSTFRHRCLTLFFCTPFESLLDKNTRRLFHARFETIGINRVNNTCRLKPRFVEFADFRDAPYRKQMIILFKGDGGGANVKKLFYWDVRKPSEKLIEQYEQKKLAFTDNLNKNISQRLKKYDDAEKGVTHLNKVDEDTLRKPLTPTQERAMRCLANNKYEDASKILMISMPAIHKSVQLAKKKGYELQEFREDG